MQLKIYLNKSLEENAGIYFDKAKKLKKKIEGAREALAESQKRKEKLLREKAEATTEAEVQVRKRERKWYEKFRWFYTSDGFLVIGGRDSTTNELAIKKHTDKNDMVFHTDMAGSPFFVIKSDNREIPKSSIQEVADATVSFSKAWKLGLQTTSVFHVKPEQVSKKAQAGEYLTKGAFMIYGETIYINNTVNLAAGTYQESVMVAPLAAIQKHCKEFIVLKQGTRKPSDIAKKFRAQFGGDLDEIIRALPSGGIEVQKQR